MRGALDDGLPAPDLRFNSAALIIASAGLPDHMTTAFNFDNAWSRWENTGGGWPPREPRRGAAQFVPRDCIFANLWQRLALSLCGLKRIRDRDKVLVNTWPLICATTPIFGL